MSTQQSAEAPTVPPIRVNEREIGFEEIAREVQYHPAPTLQEARVRAARALVVRELLLAEAGRQGIDGSDCMAGESDDEACIRKLIETEVEVPEPDQADCLRYYQSNTSRMRTADEHEVSHILVPAPPDDADIRAEARKKAMGLTAELRAHPDKFLSLAKDFSSCPSASEGGYLGWIARGQTAPEFEKSLSRLPVDEIPEYPVETRFGFHVVWIHKRNEGSPIAFEDCHEKIADYLREHVRRKAVSQYIRILAGRHEVVGFDMDGADSPMVQ
jgi:peptidyl-prolyl cis-trans isomerase C